MQKVIRYKKLVICWWNSRNQIFWMWHMEYGSGSGYPATSGGDNQNNGSRMQQTDRQQQSGLAYHHVPHQINQGKEFLASVSRYWNITSYFRWRF